MAPGHPRASIPHHGLHLLTHRRLVAVHCAVDAGGLIRTERAEVNTLLRIVPQRKALFAQVGTAAVLVPAVEADHHPDGFQFTVDAAFYGIHPAHARRRCSTGQRIFVDSVGLGTLTTSTRNS